MSELLLCESAALERVLSLRKRLTLELDQAAESGMLAKAALERLSIYATGSLARLEASPHSDLDAFFYIDGCSKDAIAAVDSIEIFRTIIHVSRESGFPDFSNGGEYLHFQFKDEVIENLGSRKDDYTNALTSRMLLILESTHLYQENLYDDMKRSIIERYFVDFHSHSKEFRPIFLLNDVLRFWRTLCINYEHRREWQSPDPVERAKGHLNNLKLRFSRLLMCYSFVASLLNVGSSVTAEDVIVVSDRTPLDRIRRLKDHPIASSSVDGLISQYEWFLEQMDHPKDETLAWISDEKNREMAFLRGSKFVESMYEIVSEVAKLHGYSRFLVI